MSLLSSTQQMWFNYGMLYAQFGQTLVSLFLVLFCIYYFIVSRNRGSRDKMAPAASSISQRVRRRFWNVTSTWALIKSCFSFSAGSSTTNAPSSSSLNVIGVANGNGSTNLGAVGNNTTNGGPTRSYPLHYKANDNFGSPGNNRRGTSIRACTCGQQAQQQQSPAQQVNTPQLVSGNSRRGYRYTPLPTTPPSALTSNGNGSTKKSGPNYSPHITKTAMLTYRYEASKAAAAAVASATNGSDD